MINPRLCIPPPIAAPVLFLQLNLKPLHQLHQQHANHQISHILAHTLARAKAEAPVIVSHLRGPAGFEEAGGAVSGRVGAPKGVPDVEGVRVDDEGGAGGDQIAVYEAGGGGGLWDREGGEGAQAGGFEDAGGEEGAGGEEVGVDTAAAWLLTRGTARGGFLALGGDFGAELGLDLPVGGEEDDVPGDAAEGDVEIGVEHLVERLVHLLVRDLALVRGGVQGDDGRVVAGRDGEVVGHFVDGVPFGAELGEGSVRFCGQVFGDGEAGEAAADDVAEEGFPPRGDGAEPALEFGRELAVDDFGDDEEGEQFQVLGRVEEALGKIRAALQLFEVAFHSLFDELDVARRRYAGEGLFADGTEILPLVPAHESDALA